MEPVAERLNYSEKRHYFWFGEVGMGGLVLARVVDAGTAQQVVGLITGMGG